MKTAKRVLAILMAMLMAVSTFAVAASAAESIASQLASGNTASISKNTRESVVIDKDATIDLGGKILKGVPGSPAITVKNGAKVKIKNGYVESYYYDYSGANSTTFETLKKIGSASPAGIQASGTGTTVTLEDVRVMGGLLRIPQQTEWYVPTGSAVKIYGGAKVQLNGAVLIGTYAVSDDPAKTGHPDGTVEVTEAIMIGFIDLLRTGGENGGAVKYDPETVEMVNAADRIAGFLNKEVHLESYEQSLLETIMDDRVFIFTQKPTAEQAIVTIDENGDGSATVKAAEIKHFRNTDCSYKYVPLYAYDAETGETYNFTTVYSIDDLKDKDIRVKYRLEFQLKGDVKKVANNFDYYFDVNWALGKLNEAYDSLMTAYQDKVVTKLGDLYQQITEAAQGTAKDANNNDILYQGKPVSISNILGEKYWALLRELLSIGGAQMYFKGTGEKFTTNRFQDPLYGNGDEDLIPDDIVLGAEHTGRDVVNGVIQDVTYNDVEVLGLMDKVDKLIMGFDKIVKGEDGKGSFKDQENWAEMVHYVLNNYTTVIDLAEEAEQRLTHVQQVLADELGEAVTRLDLGTATRTLNNIIKGLHKVNTEVKNVRFGPSANEIVQDIEARIQRNKDNGTVEVYVGKLQRLANNYREYFTPEDFLEDDGNDKGAFGKTYTVNGRTRVKLVPKAKLTLTVLGAGSVQYTPDTVEPGVAEYDAGDTKVSYTASVTLNAVPEEDTEFMYYKDSVTQRILSTNPAYVVNTQISRRIDAVFEEIGNSRVVFTNSSGGIIDDTKEYNNGVDASSVKKPTFSGYNMLGWGPNGVTSLTASDFTSAYLKGNSAFEDGAIYNVKGFAFPINGTTENKYIVTPKFKANETVTVTFHDGETEWSQTVNFGDSVPYTAQGDGFKYWADANGKVVSLYRTYSVQPAKDTDVYAVYEGEVPTNGIVNIVAVREEEERIRVFVERSIPADRKVLDAGVLVSYDSNISVPELKDVNGVKVKASHTTNLTNQGVLYGGILRTNIQTYGVVYVRGFVELQTATGSEIIYTDDVYSTIS